jgi:cytoskeletal protein RodZ
MVLPMAKGNFGERLKRERELREVSLTEITAGTRIGPRFLEALENEQWEKLPGGVFNRGFVRAIAHFLGLDEENLLAEYDLAHGEQKIQAPAPYENRLPSRPLWVSALSILVILALLSGLFYAGRYGWRLFHTYRARKYSSAAQSANLSAMNPTVIAAAQRPATSDPSRSVNSVTSASSASALTLTLSTSAATRVRILADNKVLLDAEIQAGENRRFLANDQFEITAADSSAVLLDLNGRTMPPLGMPGASGTIVLSRKNLR